MSAARLRTTLGRALLLGQAVLFAHLAGAQSAGCGGAPLPSGIHTLAHGALMRTFRLHVPPGYDGRVPAPLVLLFHGWGGDESEFLGDPAVAALADARGYLVVAPRGLGAGAPDHRNNSWTFRGSSSGVDGERGGKHPICNTAITPDYTYPSCRGVAHNTCSWTQCQDDDVAFVVELIRHLEATMCVDAAHVFAAGGSNGGMFAWELGQNPSTAPLLRAIAALVGLPHRGYLSGPGRHGSLPAILITGLADATVPPGGWDDAGFTTTSNDLDRFYYTGATAIVKRWSAAAGCDVSGREAAFEQPYPQADCRSYCPAKAPRWPTVLDCRAKMGHDYELSWSFKLIMDFFDRS